MENIRRHGSCELCLPNYGMESSKIRNTDGWANVAWLAEQVTFPFTIVYPDNDAALQELDSETYRLCKKIPPHRLHGITISRYLDRLDYNMQ